MYQWFKVCNVALMALAVSACGSDSGSADLKTGGACGTHAIQQWAYDNLTDYYLFADQVGVVDPRNYSSPSALVEDLRVQPYDRYSYITDASVSEEIFTEGKFYGIGYQWRPDDAGRVIVSSVYDDSPLGRAGNINRGDEIFAINGIELQNLTDAQYTQFVGTREQPANANWTFVDAQNGQLKTASLTPALYDINTVLHTEVIEHPSHAGKIGYLVFDLFLGTSEAELDTALADFQNQSINELVLDLRYNGGGRVSVATKLSSQIAGAVTNGQQLMEYRHNNKYAADFDFSLLFTDETIDLGLDRLIVLTTENTASSSEIVINALSPYIEVVTIGSRTNGKSYITFGNEFCGKEMHALQAEGFNANDVSVYGGIAPSCAATDDLSRNFGMSANGESTEGMLQSAIDYIVQGSCATPLSVSNPAILNDDSQSVPVIDRITENRLEPGARYKR